MTEWILQGIAFVTQNNTTGLICQLIIGFLVMPLLMALSLHHEKVMERRKR